LWKLLLVEERRGEESALSKKVVVCVVVGGVGAGQYKHRSRLHLPSQLILRPRRNASKPAHACIDFYRSSNPQPQYCSTFARLLGLLYHAGDIE